MWSTIASEFRIQHRVTFVQLLFIDRDIDKGNRKPFSPWAGRVAKSMKADEASKKKLVTRYV